MLETLSVYMAPILTFFGDRPIVQALVAILVAIIAASIFKYVIMAGLRSIVARSKLQFGSQFLALLHTPIYYSVLFIGLYIALSILTPDQFYRSIELSVFLSIALIIWTIFLLRANGVLLRQLALHPTRFSALNTKTLPLFLNLMNILIVVISVYMVFSVWNVDMTAWLASAGIVGIAVGFAAKDTLANLFAGVFIMADAPYNVGDYVILDSKERGEITHIGIRSTRMLTRDDIEITIPNSVIGNSKITNESGGKQETSRCRLPVGVSYNADIDLVKSVLMDIAMSEELVCTEPEPRVRFRRFGASALDFELLVWIDQPALKGRLIDRLNSNIYKQFKVNNIEIPYSKHDVYIKDWPSQKDDKQA